VNTFEVAVLRVLIKRQQPLKLSTLINGFPDDAEDNVLSAVSSLKHCGYLVLDDYQPNGYVSVNRERRKEILQIVDSDIHSHKFEGPCTKEKYSIPIPGKKSLHQVTTRHTISSGSKALAISSLLIVGLVSTIGISIPVATSPDSEFIAYPGYIAHSKWWNSAHGFDEDDQGDKISSARYPAVPTPFVAIKDCNQKPLYQEQT
jgi:hypothetical protein